MRERLYEITEVSEDEDKISLFYDGLMMFAIIVSMVPLTFKEQNGVLRAMDAVTAGLFICDYVLRLITADYKMKKGAESFFLYPFTGMAMIDLLSILPSLSVMHKGFKLLRLFRMMRALRIFRIFKVLRYSKTVRILKRVVANSKEALVAVTALAVGYIIISALLVFNVEPDTFDGFFDAVYWATVSLTTVGYGDLYPVSTVGRVVAMLSSFLGIAIVALPAGIITAGYMEAVQANNSRNMEKDNDEDR